MPWFVWKGKGDGGVGWNCWFLSFERGLLSEIVEKDCACVLGGIGGKAFKGEVGWVQLWGRKRRTERRCDCD